MEVKMCKLICSIVMLISCPYMLCMQVKKINMRKRNNIQDFIYKTTRYYGYVGGVHKRQKSSRTVPVENKRETHWDLVIAEKVPISYRIAKKEEGILRIVNSTENPEEITNLAEKPIQGSRLETTIIEFMYHYFDTCDRKKAKARSKFLLEQYPELRNSILYYNFKNKKFHNFIVSLRKIKYPNTMVSNLMLQDTCLESDSQFEEDHGTPKLWTPESELGAGSSSGYDTEFDAGKSEFDPAEMNSKYDREYALTNQIEQKNNGKVYYFCLGSAVGLTLAGSAVFATLVLKKMM